MKAYNQKGTGPRYKPGDEVSIYVIINVIGFDDEAYKPSWSYVVECEQCGKRHVKTQQDLANAVTNKIKNCNKCPKKKTQAQLKRTPKIVPDGVPDFASMKW